MPAGAYRYNPGETVPVAVRVFDPDPVQLRFGFQITSRTSDGCQQAGTFTPAGDAGVQIIEDFDQFVPCLPLTRGLQFPEHVLPKLGPDEATYAVNWTAPATNIGPIIFAAGGNGANADQDNTGDNIYHTQATIEVAGGHEVAGVFDAAGFQPLISPGSIVAVGGLFTEATATASSVPLSFDLNGFSVTFNDIPGALFGVFDGPFDQANVQAPWNLDVSSGKVQVKVHWDEEGEDNDFWSAPFEVDAALASPGIYMFPPETPQAIVTNFKLPDDDVIADSWAQTPGVGGSSRRRTRRDRWRGHTLVQRSWTGDTRAPDRGHPSAGYCPPNRQDRQGFHWWPASASPWRGPAADQRRPQPDQLSSFPRASSRATPSRS